MPSRTSIIAKAGGSAEHEENSLAAILATCALARRIERWSVVLEVDVRASHDGHLVLHHDATIDRLTNGTGLLADRTLAQLRALSVVPGEQRLLTLPEAWENIQGVETVVELHDPSPRALAAVSAWLGGLSATDRDRVIIASEHTRAVLAVRSQMSRVRTSATLREGLRLLACSRLGRPGWAPRGHVWMLPRRFLGIDLMERRLVQAARQAGDVLWAWVVDDVGSAQDLFALGVDGVFTTRPAGLVAELSAGFSPAPFPSPAHR